MSDNMRDVFSRIAPGWYNYRHWSIFRKELEELAKAWGRGKLLNLGCGHGADFLPFAKNFELYGIDFSDEMIRLARKYAAKFDFPVNLAVADICRLHYRRCNLSSFAKRPTTNGFCRTEAGTETRRDGFYHGLEPVAAALLVETKRSPDTVASAASNIISLLLSLYLWRVSKTDK